MLQGYFELLNLILGRRPPDDERFRERHHPDDRWRRSPPPYRDHPEHFPPDRPREWPRDEMRGPDERFVNHGFIHSLQYWNGNQHKSINHNYNKIVKSVWLSTVLISALLESVIGRHVSCL